ncbi:MAG: hypothetical protein ABR985_13905 [Methanotrichaceae archaeon]
MIVIEHDPLLYEGAGVFYSARPRSTIRLITRLIHGQRKDRTSWRPPHDRLAPQILGQRTISIFITNMNEIMYVIRDVARVGGINAKGKSTSWISS